MTTERTLIEAWSLLSPEEAGRGVATRRVGLQLTEGEVRVGLDADGSRHLLVPLDGQPSLRDTRWGGVVLVAQRLESEGSGQVFADLVCVRPELNDVFGALAADVCDTLRREADDPTSAILRALERWRQLLAPSRQSEEWTTSVMTGLMGELLVLERAVDLAGDCVLEAWTGPQKMQHDFRQGRTAVEVKTTTAREGLRVEIHGLEQLDSSAEIDLALAVVRLIPEPSGITLPELVSRLIPAVGDAGRLLDRLAAVGYAHRQTPPPDQLSHWPTFVLVDLLAWWIDQDFPVIRRSNLPTGAAAAIERLRYTVNLAAARSALSSEEFEGVLRKLST